MECCLRTQTCTRYKIFSNVVHEQQLISRRVSSPDHRSTWRSTHPPSSVSPTPSLDQANPPQHTSNNLHQNSVQPSVSQRTNKHGRCTIHAAVGYTVPGIALGGFNYNSSGYTACCDVASVCRSLYSSSSITVAHGPLTGTKRETGQSIALAAGGWLLVQ